MIHEESRKFLKVQKHRLLEKLLACAGLAALVWLAWQRRCLVDDAFITFRYAENMAKGLGLVWNAGERVEGYTNFLWVLIFMPVIKAGWDPVAASYIAGLASFALSLYLTRRLARAVLGDGPEAWLPVLLAGTNYSFGGSAGTGMETQMQTAFLTGAAWLAVEILRNFRISGPRVLGLSFFCALALLTRLDSAAYFTPLLGLCVFQVLRKKELSRPGKIKLLIGLAAPLMVLCGTWFFWKLCYYGNILPNTFYFRFLQSGSLWRGAAYIASFFIFYGLAGFAFLGVLALCQRGQRHSFCKTAFLAVFSSWFLYVVLARGDYLEFRFLVPVIPLLFVSIVWTLRVCVRRMVLRLLIAALIGLGSVSYPVSYDRLPWAIELPYKMDVMERWTQIGKALRRDLGENSDVKIAMTPAGAIPYYSGLASVDMLGHTDPWIARHGLPRDPDGSFLGNWPGHGNIAPLDYLVRNKVHIVMAHPWYIKKQSGLPKRISQTAVMVWGQSMVRFNFIKEGQIPEGARIIRIPVTDTWDILALYLTPHPAIEQLLTSGLWKACPIKGITDPTA